MNKVNRNSSYILKKTSSEIICENMGLQNQTIFQDFRCTYRQKISYFGRLYIGEQHLMFVSNMFGVVKKLSLSIDSIIRIEQPESKSLIVQAQNTDNIQHQYYFTGFQNDHSFKIINALWKREKLSPDIMILEGEDKENEANERVASGFDNSEVEISLFQEKGSEREPVKMLEIVFPCSVEQFYDFFLADNANLYSRKKHLQLRKAHSIKISNWRKNQELQAQTRQISAVIKVKGVPLVSEARMSQVCLLKKNEKNQINLKVVTNMGDVPYHSYFNCEEHVTVMRQGQTKCRYTVRSLIVFNKSTYMKGTIISKTFADFNEEYKMWSDNCKELLEKKMKEMEQAMADNVRKKGDKRQVSQVEFELNRIQNEGQVLKIQKRDMEQKKYVQKQMVNIKNRMLSIEVSLKKQNWLIVLLLVLNCISICLQIGRMISQKQGGDQS